MKLNVILHKAIFKGQMFNIFNDVCEMYFETIFFSFEHNVNVCNIAIENYLTLSHMID